jgi:predicted RNA-binding Zn ribbon-like protein
MGAKQPEPFDLCGGHPALDFVNTLDHRFREPGPTELLQDYDDLLGFMQQQRLLTAQHARLLASSVDTDAGKRALESARDLREALSATFYSSSDGTAPTPAVVQTLQRHFLSANRHQELRWKQSSRSAHEHSGMSWVWGRFEEEAELPLWMLSKSANELIVSTDVERVRACGIETCRWLFLDTSKNHSRRWCNMKVCGNRMKARRFQARRDD